MTPLRALAAATLAALSLSAHAVGRMADVTLFDRATGRELPIVWHDGRAYVVGRPGNEYQVIVRNQHGGDLLAVISVDGVNVLNGETASTRQGGYIVSPWGRIDIRGWRKSLAETAAFYFTSLGDSYAARTDRPQNVGVIGVALFERKRLEPRYQETRTGCSRPPSPSPARWRSARPPRSAPATGGARNRTFNGRNSSAPPRNPPRRSRSTTTATATWSRAGSCRRPPPNTRPTPSRAPSLPIPDEDRAHPASRCVLSQ